MSQPTPAVAPNVDTTGRAAREVLNVWRDYLTKWKIAGVTLQGAIDRLIRKKDGTWIVVDYKSSILEESSRSSANRCSADVSVGAGSAAPVTARACTRRTFVSTTAYRAPNAKLATAAAV